MADKKNKSKDKDPYLERNEFKKDFYNQSDKPPVTADTIYGTGTIGTMSDKQMQRYLDDRDAIRREANRFENLNEPKKMEPMPYIMDTDPSTLTSGRSPEEYKKFKEVPFERRDYKNGGDVHVEKGHDYIKDLIK